MTYTIDIDSRLRRTAKLSARLAFSAALVFGMFAAGAGAAEHGGGSSGGHSSGGGHSDADRGGRGGGRGYGGWSGGYYPAPVLVYGQPGYCAPPLVYGPYPNYDCEED
jgi:hypothetical protein